MGDKSSPDDLLVGGPDGPISLTDNDLEDAVGGSGKKPQDVNVTKTKTSSKNHAAISTLIKG